MTNIVKKKRSKVQEGAWYGVPLTDGSWGLVLVARASPKAAPLGYFFGPAMPDPGHFEVEALSPKNAATYRIFSSAGISDGSWPLVRPANDGWRREAWPVPPLLQPPYADDKSHEWIVQFDDDVVEILSKKKVAAGEVTDLPSAGMPGDISMCRQLGELLAKQGAK